MTSASPAWRQHRLVHLHGGSAGSVAAEAEAGPVPADLAENVDVFVVPFHRLGLAIESGVGGELGEQRRVLRVGAVLAGQIGGKGRQATADDRGRFLAFGIVVHRSDIVRRGVDFRAEFSVLGREFDTLHEIERGFGIA